MEQFHKQWRNVSIRKWIYDELERLSAQDGRSLSNYLEFQLVHYLKLEENSDDE